MFLLTLSSSLVALGFVVGMSPQVFVPFAVAALTVVFVLGLFTVLRLVDISVLNVRTTREMVRIRRFYATLSADAPRFFGANSDEDDEALTAVGARVGPLAYLGTVGSMIGAVNAVVGGAGVAAVLAVAFTPTPVAVVAGVVSAIAVFAVVLLVQRRRFFAGLAG